MKTWCVELLFGADESATHEEFVLEADSRSRAIDLAKQRSVKFAGYRMLIGGDFQPKVFCIEVPAQ